MIGMETPAGTPSELGVVAHADLQGYVVDLCGPYVVIEKVEMCYCKGGYAKVNSYVMWVISQMMKPISYRC